MRTILCAGVMVQFCSVLIQRQALPAAPVQGVKSQETVPGWGSQSGEQDSDRPCMNLSSSDPDHCPLLPSAFAPYLSEETNSRLAHSAVQQCCSFKKLDFVFAGASNARKNLVSLRPGVVSFGCNSAVCGGIGDRIRGLSQVFLEAKHLGLSFGLHGSQGLFSGLLRTTRAANVISNPKTHTKKLAIEQWDPHGSLQVCEWMQYDYVEVSSNVIPTGVVGCAERNDYNSLFFRACNRSSVIGCVWWYIMRVDARLEKEILRELEEFANWKRRNNRERNPVIGVHIRAGDISSGFSGTAVTSDDIKRLEELADQAVLCGVHLGEDMRLDHATLLILSDSIIVKARCHLTHPARTWSSATVPAHIEKSSAIDRHLGSLVDLLLLSLCDAIVKSESGFSHLSAAIGMYPPERMRSLETCGLKTRADM